MSSILEFPESRERAWRAQENALRATVALTGNQMTAAELDYICASVKPVYLRASETHSFSGSTPDEAIRSLNDWVFSLSHDLLLHIFKLEIELAVLRGVPAVASTQIPSGSVVAFPAERH